MKFPRFKNKKIVRPASLPRTHFVSALLVTSLLLSITVPVFALDPARSIEQYGHDVWQTDQGLPSNSIQAIVQTRDGYLWLGTKAGLVRFDGISFTIFDKRNTPALRSNDISGLSEDRAGNLWISTYGGGLARYWNGEFIVFTTREGLASDFVSTVTQDRAGALWFGTAGGLHRFQNGRFTVFTVQDGLLANTIGSIHEDRAGNLWIGTGGGLNLFRNESFTAFTTRDGLPGNNIVSLVEDRMGSLWIGTDGGLARFGDEEFTSYTTREGLSSNSVRTIYEDRAGSLWIGTTGGGLNRMRDGEFSRFTHAQGLSSDYVGAIMEDREGSLWVGTYGSGLNRLKDGKFTTYTVRNGLSNNFAFSIHEDRAGGIWIGTYGGGVNYFKDGRFTHYTTADGLSDNVVRAVFEDRAGDVWIGTYSGGLNRFRNGRFTSYTTADGLSNNAIYAIYEDRAGDLWVGTDGGLNCLRRRSGVEGEFEITVFNGTNGLPSDVVRAIHEDRQGNLWIGTYGGGLVRLRAGEFTAFTMRDGLSDDFVRSIYEDEEGALWIATYGGGVDRLKDNRFTSYTTNEGLYDNTVYQVLDDGHGYLWMSSNRGIFRVSRAELNHFADGRVNRVTSDPFGRSDGMLSSECNGGNQPAGTRTRDGRLWFPTIEGIAVIDPANVLTNNQPPPVLIESIVVHGRAIERRNASATVSAAATLGSERYEFRYTALSFLAPEKVRFRYQLEGFDRDWIDAGTERVARYTNLPPGAYTFRVIACNNDGVWNESGATLEFSIKPYFYQTKIFFVLCALALVLVAASLYGLRMRHVKARQRELVSLIRTRTRQLEEANAALKELSIHDALTGLANRRHFDEFFDREWRRAVREEALMSLIMIDIDCFKSYNDLFGHQPGDECLRRVANVLKEMGSRPSDLIARYGGEEFTVVLYGAKIENAVLVAERLRAKVEDLRIPHPHSQPHKHITISLGVATIRPTLDDSPAALFAAADNELYKAKRAGRNRVCSVLLTDTVPDELIAV